MTLSSWQIPVENGSLGGLDNHVSAPDVLFIHSHGFAAMTWACVIEKLGDSVHAVAMDLRGHANSDAPLLTANSAWRDIITVIEELGLTKPILVGHNSGGYMALAAAADRPEVISSVITLDGDLGNNSREDVFNELQLAQELELQKSLEERFLFGRVAKTSEEVEQIVTQMIEVATNDWLLGSVGPEIAPEVRYAMRQLPDGSWLHTPTVEATTAGYVFDLDTPYFPNWELYEKVSVPVHVVRCTQGLNAVSDADAMQLRTRFPLLSVHTLAAGHLAQYSHRTEVADLIKLVVKELPGLPRP